MRNEISYLLWLTALEWLIVWGGWICFNERWLYAQQVQEHLTPMPEKYLTYLGHGAVLGMAVIGNTVAAHIFNKYGGTWGTQTVMLVFFIMTVIGIQLVNEWIKDPVMSCFVRNGQPTAALFLHTISMIIIFSAAFLYYACTAEVDKDRVVLITFLLIANLVCSLLVPPLAVHGKLHAVAVWQFVGGSALLIVGGLRVYWLPSFHF